MFGVFSTREGCLIEAASGRTRTEFLDVLLDGAPAWLDGPRRVADAASVGRAWLASGPACLRALDGAFALAVVDRRNGSLHLAIDRMGIASLAIAAQDEVIVFGTSAHAVAGHAPRPLTLRAQAIFDYFLFHMVPAPGSIFRGVEKLRAGHIRTFGARSTHDEAYWQPQFDDRAGASAEKLAAGLHEALGEAVAWASQSPHQGAFLSGGLDSSTVSGVLANLHPGASTFSIGFGVEGYDELEYARIASNHFRTSAHEYVVTPADVLAAIPVVAGAYDEPFGNSSAIPTYLCARLAREHGVDTLLAGDGGDEIFGGNERYARQRIFEIFQRTPSALRSLAIAGTRWIPAEGGLTALRKVRSYVDQARVPLPERLEAWNFVYREGASLLFEQAFMELVDAEAPLRAMAAVYHETGNVDLLDRMLVYDWKYTLADNDLRKVSTMCAAAGVSVRYPMLDAAVVDLSLRVPSTTKMEGLELRSFYKRAMKGFLPDAILEKRKHGFGLPFGVWLKSHAPLAEFIYECLERFRSRGIVKSAFIDRLIAEHRGGHPGYYGYVIWDLVILEEWLERLPAVTISPD
jgi:asparagine synthase (glutamine-hydrolysing)